MAYRELQPGDAPEIIRIISESRAASVLPFGMSWSAEQTRSECEQGGWVDVAADGRVFAFVLLRQLPGALEVSFLATSPDARGQGRMAALLQHLLAALPRQRAVWLEVHESNESARRLYAKLGFKQVGKRSSYYADGGAAVLYNYG